MIVKYVTKETECLMFVIIFFTRMSDINKRRLVFSIIQFLNREMSSDDMSEDAKESLEVASQCLQTAFSFNVEDVHLEVSKTLEQIFKEATHNEPVKHFKGTKSLFRTD